MVFDSQRREFLKYGGVAAGTVLAGCAGGSGGGNPNEEATAAGSGSAQGAGETTEGGESGQTSDQGTTSGELSDTVVMYGIDEFETRALGKSFKEEYGPSIQTTVLLGGQNSGRYVREHRNGVHNADIVQGYVENNIALINAEDDLIADPELPNYDKLMDDEYFNYLADNIYKAEEPVRQMAPLGGFLSCFAYNSNLVDEPPQNWDDLLSERFKDDIILLTYNVSGVWDHYEREHGEEAANEFLVALDEQNPTYIDGSPVAAAQKVGSGSAKVAPDSFVAHTAMLSQQGLPLEWSWGEFIWRQHWSLMLMEHAPHFETAKQFCQYATSKAGQQQFSKLFGGVATAHEDVPHGNPDAEERLQSYEGTIRPQSQWDEREAYCDERVNELIGI